MVGRLEQPHSQATAAAVAFALLGLLTGGCGSSHTTATTTTNPTSASSLAPIRKPYSPKIDPASFVAAIDNPLLPLKPGTAFHYEGVRGKTPQTDDEVVTNRTVRILGIRCTVVRDTVSEQGRPIERTLDFYAQDRQGNVWYMGEDSFELKH